MTEISDMPPLFVPGPSVRSNYAFVCNIEDELSLWRQRETNTFRVYSANGRGAYLNVFPSEDALRAYEEVVRGDGPYDLSRSTIELYRTIVKHRDILTVYTAMLRRAP